MAEAEKTKSDKETPNPSNLLIVERYKRSQRLHHWVHVILMIFFLFTGLELFIQMYFIGDYYITRNLHLFIGIFIGFWDLIIFPAIVIRFRKYGELIPTPRDFLDMFIIFLCAIKILPDSKYPHYDYYNVDEKKYIMKYHPAQKVLSLTNMFAILAMGITGIVLSKTTHPGQIPAFLVDLFSAIVSPLDLLGIDIRFVHFLVFLYFIMTTMIHFYFAIIPQNRERLRGMITGNEKIPLEK
ncbi:MAG: cytochrome b/b6 domain-containing protein [Candidatus Hodarchaeales archaeon]|jgi:cytochrome b subunit of formate dehydrogenase